MFSLRGVYANFKWMGTTDLKMFFQNSSFLNKHFSVLSESYTPVNFDNFYWLDLQMDEFTRHSLR